jgi:hypothetical protein
MARFIFYLLDDSSVDYIEGKELPDVAAAREQAHHFAIDIAASSQRHRNFDPTHSIRVVGDAGVLIEVKLGDVARH